MFQTEEAAQGNEIHTVNIDASRTIRKVSLKVDGMKIGGMRLLDERNDYVMNATWNSARRGRWLTRTLSPGLEIIGLQCNTNYMRIMNLGFLLWRPRPRAMDVLYDCTQLADRTEIETQNNEEQSDSRRIEETPVRMLRTSRSPLSVRDSSPNYRRGHRRILSADIDEIFNLIG